MKIIVIGAGIFGVTITLELSKRHDVTLVDSNNYILQNASKVNHNRIHFGFHYPRSEATAWQCLEGYELFYDYFKNAITFDFPNYYMIERNSLTSIKYYEYFCNVLKLNYTKERPDIEMNFDRIESSYSVFEPIFDYSLIELKLKNNLQESKIKLILNKEIKSKKDLKGYDIIINATYFNINKLKRIFDLPQTKLRLQTVIIPIFKWHRDKIGLTIMDGKYCSIMPKGFNQDTFLLYHAKESVIFETEREVIPLSWYFGKKIINNRFIKKEIYDKYIAKYYINRIVEASWEYFTFLKDCKIVDYWQTVRALPVNNNDERLSIFDISERGNQKVISVLSGKISTCLLTAQNISKIL